MVMHSALTSDPDFPETTYVPLSGSAVVVLILGLLSVLCLAHAAFFMVPLAGVVVGGWSLAKILRAAGQLGGRWLALIGLALSLGFLIVGGSLRAYEKVTEVEPGYTAIPFDLFRTYVGGPQVPPELAALNGQKVHVRGFMVPSRQTEGLTSFLLVRDNKTCCFGAQPALTDMVVTQMAAGRTTDYHTDVAAVGGTLHVGERRTGGVVVSLYELEADYVK